MRDDNPGPAEGRLDALSRGRAWPWFVLGVVLALVMAFVSDSFGWPTWVRGSLMGICAGGGGALAARIWKRRHASPPSRR